MEIAQCVYACSVLCTQCHCACRSCSGFCHMVLMAAARHLQLHSVFLKACREWSFIQWHCRTLHPFVCFFITSSHPVPSLYTFVPGPGRTSLSPTAIDLQPDFASRPGTSIYRVPLFSLFLTFHTSCFSVPSYYHNQTHFPSHGRHCDSRWPFAGCHVAQGGCASV